MRRIVLRDGDLVTAASSADDETLVAFLAARGDLDRDAAARLGTKLPPFGRHAGAALIAHGYLGQDDLWPVLRAHAEWIIGRALQETTGAFEHRGRAPGPPQGRARRLRRSHRRRGPGRGHPPRHPAGKSPGAPRRPHGPHRRGLRAARSSPSALSAATRKKPSASPRAAPSPEILEGAPPELCRRHLRPGLPGRPRRPDPGGVAPPR